ncbi:MAG: endonuclease/exonuclease/phosphatase family protein [Clostridia bacterium]|nr:endonuclease/exonuclease/phosphatase family protein [Clostridia bacterium]
MKKIVYLLIILLIYFFVYIPSLKPVGEKKIGDLRIVSYNLKYGSSNYDEWKIRKDIIAKQVLKYDPDSIGVQEADSIWMNEEDGLPKIFKGYSYVGVGRDDGDKKGEYAAIFYKTDKYKIKDSGTFWISETPDKPSIGWDAVCNRICTWVTLEDVKTGEIYTHFNLHLDHKGDVARVEGVRLVLERLEEIKTPYILTGDFNFMEGTIAYKMMIRNKEVEDSKYLAEDTMSYGTINWFYNFNFKHLKPIDFCFVSKEKVRVKKYRVDNSYLFNGKPVSDHYPVIVDLSLKD